MSQKYDDEHAVVKCMPRKGKNENLLQKKLEASGRKGGKTKKTGMPVLDPKDPSDNAFDLVSAISLLVNFCACSKNAACPKYLKKLVSIFS